METVDKPGGSFARRDDYVVDWQLVSTADAARYGIEDCEVRARLSMHNPVLGKRKVACGLRKESREIA